jgi:hypothetical protein
LLLEIRAGRLLLAALGCGVRWWKSGKVAPPRAGELRPALPNKSRAVRLPVRSLTVGIGGCILSSSRLM